MRFYEFIPLKRQQLGMSQASLAEASGVSIPFIQLIEAGKANPSIQILEACLSALGFRLDIKESEPKWAEIVQLGVPLGQAPKLVWNGKTSAGKIRTAYHFSKNNRGFSKEFDAIEGYLIAFRDHYPTYFKKMFPDFEKTLPTDLNGRQIKLRRIALSNLAKLI